MSWDARSGGAAFLPCLGVYIYRTPLNGRAFEYLGEDPLMGSAIAVGYFRGVEQQQVSDTAEHFIGNNPEYLRWDSDSMIGERALCEIYTPIFEA